jgi:hypothetical protein
VRARRDDMSALINELLARCEDSSVSGRGSRFNDHKVGKTVIPCPAHELTTGFLPHFTEHVCQQDQVSSLSPGH